MRTWVFVMLFVLHPGALPRVQVSSAFTTKAECERTRWRAMLANVYPKVHYLGCEEITRPFANDLDPRFEPWRTLRKALNVVGTEGSG